MHSITSLPRMMCARPEFTRLSLALAAGVLLSHCSSAPKSEVVVSVKDQRMGLYHDGVLAKQYAISTSKFGLGDQLNSYRTPVGKCEVIAKIGHGLPAGAVLKSRHWNGEVLKPNAPGRDPIVSRILWLRGLETSNRNTMKRYIYIHGTPEESRLGQPASYGCIRMGMKDVVDVFNDVGIGAKVVITKDHLPHGGKAEQPKVELEVAPTAAPAPIMPPTVTPPVPVETTTLAAAVPAKGKAGKTEKASPAPVAATSPVAPVVAEQRQKKSFFSFLSRKSKADTAAEVMAPAPVPVQTAATTAPKTGLRAGEHQIGPDVPETVAKSKGKKDRTEKVSTTTSKVTRLLSFNNAQG